MKEWNFCRSCGKPVSDQIKDSSKLDKIDSRDNLTGSTGDGDTNVKEEYSEFEKKFIWGMILLVLIVFLIGNLDFSTESDEVTLKKEQCRVMFDDWRDAKSSGLTAERYGDDPVAIAALSEILRLNEKMKDLGCNILLPDEYNDLE